MERENKPVSFNPKKPDEAAMLKYIKRRQFSKYVKKLIAEDMKTKGQAKTKISSPPEENSRYESHKVPQQYSNESPSIPQNKKEPTQYTQAKPSYPTQQHPPGPPQLYPTQPPADPRNRPLINPQPRGH